MTLRSYFSTRRTSSWLRLTMLVCSPPFSIRGVDCTLPFDRCCCLAYINNFQEEPTCNCCTACNTCDRESTDIMSSALRMRAATLVTAVVLAKWFYKVKPVAGYLLWPYVAFLAFANCLNWFHLQENSVSVLPMTDPPNTILCCTYYQHCFVSPLF